MKLVPDAKQSWKWYSQRTMAIAAVLPFAWEQMPPELKSAVPDAMMPYIVAAVLVAGMIGRLIEQENA